MISINLVNTSAESFRSLVGKLNQCINAISNNCITANGTANGSYTTGNAFNIGIFGSNTIVATTIRGGNVQSSASLTITANVITTVNNITVGNSTVNIFANATSINVSTNSTVGFIANTSAITLNAKSYTNLDPHIIIANNYVTIGDRPKLNFVGSGTVSISTIDETSNNQVTVIISGSGGGGGGTPGGSNTQIQYNDSGSFNGSSGFMFDKTTNIATIANTLVVSNTITTSIIDLGFGQLTAFAVNVATVSAVVLDSFLLASYRGGKYMISVKDNTANAFQISEMLVLQDIGDGYVTEYGQIYSNGSIATYSANANSTHFKLNYTAATNNTTVRIYRQLIGIAG